MAFLLGELGWVHSLLQQLAHSPFPLDELDDGWDACDVLVSSVEPTLDSHARHY